MEIMRLALIPPLDLLDWTCQTDMQLMLPQLLGDERYRYTYRKHCEDPDQYVILDNGAAEEQQVAGYRLLDIAMEYDVDEIVIPDKIADYLRTIEMLEGYISFLIDEKVGPDMFNFMFVAQGQNMREFQKSIEYALQHSYVTTIGLPRHAPTTTGIINIRHLLSRWFEKNHGNEGVKIHLLGGSPYQPTELKNTPWPKIVRSHDTSSPFNFAYAGKVLRLGNCVKRPVGYFGLAANDFMAARDSAEGTCLEYNVQKLKEWCGIYDNASHH